MNFHVITGMGYVVIVPQLVMLVLVAEEKTSMMMQFILTVVILVMTGVTQTVQTIQNLHSQREDTCLQRRTCAHHSWGWYFFVNNVWFSVTVLIRLLFNLRWKTWLTGLRVVGPLLAFLTSRKCREFQALCLMACLGT